MSSLIVVLLRRCLAPIEEGRLTTFVGAGLPLSKTSPQTFKLKFEGKCVFVTLLSRWSSNIAKVVMIRVTYLWHPMTTYVMLLGESLFFILTNDIRPVTIDCNFNILTNMFFFSVSRHIVELSNECGLWSVEWSSRL